MASKQRRPSGVLGNVVFFSGWCAVAFILVLSSVRKGQQLPPPSFCSWNPFLRDFSAKELLSIEDNSADFLANMYHKTMAKYDSLINCTDKGEPHPTACPINEPTGPHVQYSLIQPTMDCRNKKLFGASKMDGAKHICSADRLAKGCTVYSLGSANDFSFEDDIIKNTPCSVHTFDCTIGRKTGPVKDRLNFYETCIAGKSSSDGKYKSIADIMKELGHKHVDLLKMDIEGFEQLVFAEWQPKDKLPGQMIIEIHGCNPAVRHKYRHLALAEMQLMFAKIMMLGYRLAVLDPQPGCSNCVEVAFIRTVCP